MENPIRALEGPMRSVDTPPLQDYHFYFHKEKTRVRSLIKIVDTVSLKFNNYSKMLGTLSVPVFGHCELGVY